jgi:hypothetical protein
MRSANDGFPSGALSVTVSNRVPWAALSDHPALCSEEGLCAGDPLGCLISITSRSPSQLVETRVRSVRSPNTCAANRAGDRGDCIQFGMDDAVDTAERIGNYPQESFLQVMGVRQQLQHGLSSELTREPASQGVKVDIASAHLGARQHPGDNRSIVRWPFASQRFERGRGRHVQPRLGA